MVGRDCYFRPGGQGRPLWSCDSWAEGARDADMLEIEAQQKQGSLSAVFTNVPQLSRLVLGL